MAKLIGAQQMVLKAISDLPKDSAGYVTDLEVARNTQIALNDVRDWIETLAIEELIDVARTTAGLSLNKGNWAPGSRSVSTIFGGSKFANCSGLPGLTEVCPAPDKGMVSGYPDRLHLLQP